MATRDNMEATLSSIPFDTIDIIAGHLELADLLALRFTSRDLRAKVTASRRFEKFCESKAVELRVSSLKDLKELLYVPGPQKYLQHLTLTGVLVTTKGLERIIRERTKPANLNDPCCIRRGELGIGNVVPRLPATDGEVEDASVQLSDFQQQVHTANAEQASGQDLAALADLFVAIKVHCKARGLKSLTLDLIVRREPNTTLSPALGAPWRQVWDNASHIASICVRAWSRSAIRIERLDIFSKTEACAIEVSSLAALRRELDSDALRDLRSFSVSLSNRALPLNRFTSDRNLDRDDERLATQRQSALHQSEASYSNVPQMLGTMRQQIMRLAGTSDAESPEGLRETVERLIKSHDNVTGLADWLSGCPDLETLHVRSYYVTNGYHASAPDDSSMEQIWTHVANKVRMPKLRKLAILRANIDAGGLLKLLQSSPQLNRLDFREVDLASPDGLSWKHIFAHMTSRNTQISSIYLDNIFGHEAGWKSYIACFTPGFEPGGSASTGETAKERKKRLSLVDYWDFRRPSAKGYSAFELTRREDVLRGIDYVANGGYVMGSVQNSMWMEYRKRQYGPLG